MQPPYYKDVGDHLSYLFQNPEALDEVLESLFELFSAYADDEEMMDRMVLCLVNQVSCAHQCHFTIVTATSPLSLPLHHCHCHSTIVTATSPLSLPLHHCHCHFTIVTATSPLSLPLHHCHCHSTIVTATLFHHLRLLQLIENDNIQYIGSLCCIHLFNCISSTDNKSTFKTSLIKRFKLFQSSVLACLHEFLELLY